CREGFEDGRPCVALIEPGLPALVEGVLDFGGQTPERHAARRIEELSAAAARHFEDDVRLGEEVRPREAALQDHRPVATEHALAVPPASQVHLAEAGDDQPQLEETLK